MSARELARWQAEALALKPDEVAPLGMPIAMFLFEAEAVARFVETYWKPAADGSHPGLITVKKRLSKTIAADIESLVIAARSVQVQSLFPPDDDGHAAKLATRGTELLKSLGAAIEYLLDDDVHEPADDAWATAKAHAAADATLPTFVQALEEYAGIADELKARLADLDDFDATWITDAKRIAKELAAAGRVHPQEASKHVDLRNRLLTLLLRKINDVRRSARYVFRDQPDIVRLATSAYQRNRRIEARRAKPVEPSPPTAPKP